MSNYELRKDRRNTDRLRRGRRSRLFALAPVFVLDGVVALVRLEVEGFAERIACAAVWVVARPLAC